MDDTLIDAYCQENSLGHKVGRTFSTHAMDNIVKELKSNPDKAINKEKIHDRMKIIKRHFNKYYDIFQTSRPSEFAWDPITNKFIAEPEVWDQLIQVNLYLLVYFLFLLKFPDMCSFSYYNIHCVYIYIYRLSLQL